MIARIVLVGAAVLLLQRVLSGADLAHVGALVGARGPLLLLVLAPYALAIAADAAAWRLLIGVAVPYARVYQIRLSCEAILLSLPFGAVAAEALKPGLLARRCAVPMSRAISSVAARKTLVMAAQALYLLGAVVLGFPSLRAGSRAILGIDGLPWLLLGAAAIFAFASLGLQALLRRGALAGRLHAFLRALQIRPLTRWLERRRASFTAVDGQLAAPAPLRTRALALVLLYAVWLIEAGELLLILRLAGVRLGYGEALAIEASASLIRSFAFFAPAGLGLQDLGYLVFLRAFGVAGALDAAAVVVLVKRSKEIFWILVGYALLARPAPGVVAHPGGLDLRPVALRPAGQGADWPAQRAPERSERVFHARRYGGEDGAADQPVALQAAQGERQHALGNPLDPAA
jgi:hypothetical protein